jgi:hypothetical protein
VAEHVTGRMKLAVESEGCAGEVVFSVVTKTKIIISGCKRRLFSFLLLEYDFCLLDWIRVDFTSQVQINKQTNSEKYIRFD